jgi:hypothetical protein
MKVSVMHEDQNVLDIMQALNRELRLPAFRPRLEPALYKDAFGGRAPASHFLGELLVERCLLNRD